MPRTVVAAVLALLAAGAPARAAQLYPGDPAVAVGPDGTEAVAWPRLTGSVTGPTQILAAVRPPNGGFSPPVVLAGAPEAAAFSPAPNDILVDSPQAFTDAAGDVLITWDRVTAKPARYTPDLSPERMGRWYSAGRWSAPLAISSSPDDDPAVALGADGTAYAVSTPESTSAPLVAVARPGAAFGTPRRVAGLPPTPHLAATDGGAWLLGRAAAYSGPLRLVRLRADGTPTGSLDLTPANGTDVASALGTGADGSAVVASQQSASPTVQVAVVSPSGQVRSTSADLDPTGTPLHASFAALGLSHDGTATVLGSAVSAREATHGVVIDAPATGAATVTGMAGVVPTAGSVADDGSAVVVGIASNGSVVGAARPASGVAPGLDQKPTGAAGPVQAFAPFTLTAPGRSATRVAFARSDGRTLAAWADSARPFVDGDGTDIVALDGSGRTTLDGPVPWPALPNLRVLVPSKTAQLRRGRLRFMVRCPGAAGQAPCRMTVAVRRRSGGKTLRLEPLTATVPAGGRRAFSVTIPARLRRRFAHAHAVAVYLTGVGDASTISRRAVVRVARPR